MRWLAVLIILMAGCTNSVSEPSNDTGLPPDGPLHVAPTFDGVDGSVSRSGIYYGACEAVSMNGAANPRHTSFTFEAPENATSVQIRATWSDGPEALTFNVASDNGGTAFSGTSPLESSFSLAGFTDRAFTASIAAPACVRPAFVEDFGEVVADLAISFR